MAFSPLTQRRFHQFRQNKRAFYGLWLFLGLFLLTLCAEVICYNKPFVVYCEGSFYFPFFNTYADKTFGGTFATEVDYKDPYTQNFIARKGGWMLWPPVRYTYSTVNLDRPAPSPPSAENFLGADDLGRDVFARLLYGFRLSLSCGLILMLCTAVLAISAGAFQGYFGGGGGGY